MRTFLVVILGGLLGGLLSAWLSPKTIAWYFEPPVEIGINCRPAVEWAMDRLVIAEGLGMGVGAFLAGLIYWQMTKKKKNRSQLTS